MKRSSLKKKAKEHSQSWYRKKCVERAKKVALERDGYTCVRCGKSKANGNAIHGSHVYPEGKYHGMSANPLNIKALCYQCHFQWWHKDVMEAKEWFETKYPDRAKELKMLSRQTIQINWKQEYEQTRHVTI
jgi:hypothetical protein